MMKVFWDVTPLRLVNGHRRFEKKKSWGQQDPLKRR